MPSLIVRVRDREVSSAPIVKAETRIGRDPQCDLVIDNPAVSRVHASVRIEGNDAVIVDCESANGLMVNGVATKWQILKEGDVVQIGKFHITFDASGSPTLAELGRLKLPTENVSRDTINPEGTVHMSADDIQKLAKTYDPEIGSLATIRATAKPLRRTGEATAVMRSAAPPQRRVIIYMGVAIAILVLIVAFLVLKKP